MTDRNEELVASPDRTYQNFPRFSHLPFELRTKIWLMTFEPRTIKVRVEHHGNAATPVAVTFQASLGVLALRGFCRFHETYNCNKPLCRSIDIAVPRGPIALQICTESREMALKSYQRCFAGTNRCPRDTLFAQQWEKSGFAEPKIWVNFRLDVIVMELLFDYPHFSPNISPLPDFTLFAPRETKLIQHFAMRASWNDIWPRTAPPTLILPFRLEKNFASMALFKSLEELSIISSNPNHETLDSVKDSEVKLQEEINALMRKEHMRAVEWAADMPVVRIESEFMLAARTDH